MTANRWGRPSPLGISQDDLRGRTSRLCSAAFATLAVALLGGCDVNHQRYERCARQCGDDPDPSTIEVHCGEDRFLYTSECQAECYGTALVSDPSTCCFDDPPECDWGTHGFSMLTSCATATCVATRDWTWPLAGCWGDEDPICD